MQHPQEIQDTNTSKFTLNDHNSNYVADWWQSTMDAIDDLLGLGQETLASLLTAYPSPSFPSATDNIVTRCDHEFKATYPPLAFTAFDDFCGSSIPNVTESLDSWSPPLRDDQLDQFDLQNMPLNWSPTPPFAIVNSPSMSDLSPGSDTPPLDPAPEVRDLRNPYTMSPASSSAHVATPSDGMPHSEATQDAGLTLPSSRVQLCSELEWRDQWDPEEQPRLEGESYFNKPQPQPQIHQETFRLQAREAERTSRLVSENVCTGFYGRLQLSSGKAPYIEREEDNQINPIPNGSRSGTKRKREDEPPKFIMDKLHVHSGSQMKLVVYHPGGSSGTPDGVELETERPSGRNRVRQRGGSEVGFQIIEYEHCNKRRRR